MKGSIAADNIRLKRAYDRPDAADGKRILIDRLWPRGVTKSAAAIDQWVRDIAPSTELRKWFGHDPARWEEFRTRYAAEIGEHPRAFADLCEQAGQRVITLIYSARDEEFNDAIVLRDMLLGRAVT